MGERLQRVEEEEKESPNFPTAETLAIIIFSSYVSLNRLFLSYTIKVSKSNSKT